MSTHHLKRSRLQTLLSMATAGLLLAAGSIHAQTASEGSKANNQSGKAGSSQMNNQGSSSGTGSAAGSTSPKSSSGASAQGSDASGSSAAGSTAGGDSKSASRSSDATGKLSKSDQEMMNKIAQTNIAEIETAKLAQEKSQSEEVRSFAKKMIDDHTKAQDELQKIAQSKGASLPEKPDAKHQAAMKKMESLSGKEFDSQYMKQAGVNDHREAHKLLQRVSKEAKDDDLKQYATKTIAAVDEHGKMAKGMKPGKSGSSSGSSAGGSGGSDASRSTGGSGSGTEKTGADKNK